ncbi:hypothetical protein Y032_0338g2923 [Ancylostoma ceylanicum]|uniref:GIY-YIG domain-containing protein n=1 Tax=Ancylostoma ceylanicum TaxID=53326 RepID=A0A016RZ51_9BILA|nr:hypothetical protein Y032_0338g2923 [Ancylostoma ceylanicum]
MVSGGVYLITCQSCGDQYIGETGRPLCIRIKEHLDAMTRSRVTTALGGHRRHSHGNSSFEVAVTILSSEPEIVARKTLEAFWITEGRVYCRDQRTGSVPRPLQVLIYGVERGTPYLLVAAHLFYAAVPLIATKLLSR